MSEFLAGVELGGTKCLCVLASHAGKLIEVVQVATTAPEPTLQAIEGVLSSWRIAERATALGIASFGPLDLNPASPSYGFIMRTPKPGWNNTDLASRLSRRFGLRTRIETDVNAAALAEGRWGGGRGLHAHAYVTVGTGVGVGIVIDGRPIFGAGHPEAGHMRVPRIAGDTWSGACIYHGDCVEGLASGPAIAMRAGRSAKLLAAADPIWETVAHTLAGFAHNLILTVAPQRILFGGGVVTGQRHLLPTVRRMLAASLGGYGVDADFAERLDEYIAEAFLGAQAGPAGTIAVAADAFNGIAAA